MKSTTLLMLLLFELQTCYTLSFQPPMMPHYRQETRRQAKNEKNMSASEKERREEEKRRQERKGEVVIGRTSAIAGEKDFPINPKSTQEQWMNQASRVEQEVYRQTELGMEYLKMLRLEEAVKAFDRVFELRPNAYCWQAGIAKYYLGDLIGAANIFARSVALYESKFGGPASEERIWRDACELKFLSGLSRKAREDLVQQGGVKQIIAQAKEFDDESFAPMETRKVIRITKELFSASTEKDMINLALSRAKLRSICGAFDEKPRMDRKMWKLNSWFYLGLHYDALGHEQESKECMKMALRLCPTCKGEDIVHALPLLHMSRRDWFDDDEFDKSSNDVEKISPPKDSVKTPLGIKSDHFIIKSLQSDISKMTFQELKTALKSRGIKSTGSKEEMQSRLFLSLIDDVGLQL
jgi:tetratricopeptide (TPR) repeat protein